MPADNFARWLSTIRYFPDPPGNVTEQNGERKHGHCARIDSGGTPPRPVSAACPPNLFTIHSSLFTKNARYRYRVVVDAQTKAPLAIVGVVWR